jgi:hypothetical protein
MKERIIEIDKEIDSLEKEKKNFARRINYKIKKLKEEKSGLLFGLNDENEPEKTQEPIELMREEHDYHVFSDNKWVKTPFLELVPGNCFRVWVNGKAQQIGSSKIFEVMSYPYTNHKHRHTIKIKHPDLPIRSIKEEINMRVSGKV